MKNFEKSKAKYFLLEFIAISLFATAGVFIRKISLSPTNIGLWRFVLALPFLFAFAYKDLKDTNNKEIPFMILSGMFLGFDAIFFNRAIIITSLANTNVLGNMTCFVIVPLSYILFKEKIPKFFVAGLITTVIGVIILVTGKQVATKSNYIGDMFAIIASVAYALYFLSIHQLRKKNKSNVLIFFSTLGSALTIIIALLFMEGIQIPTIKNDIVNLLLFSMFMQVIGHSLLAVVQGKLNVNLISAITLLQPVIAAIFSLIAFKEKLTIKEMIGIVIVITGVYFCKLQFDEKK